MGESFNESYWKRFLLFDNFDSRLGAVGVGGNHDVYTVEWLVALGTSQVHMHNDGA